MTFCSKNFRFYNFLFFSSHTFRIPFPMSQQYSEKKGIMYMASLLAYKKLFLSSSRQNFCGLIEPLFLKICAKKCLFVGKATFIKVNICFCLKTKNQNPKLFRKSYHFVLWNSFFIFLKKWTHHIVCYFKNVGK